MLEKLIERLKEIEDLFNQTLASLHALGGAKTELQKMIDWHNESANQSAKDGEVV